MLRPPKPGEWGEWTHGAHPWDSNPLVRRIEFRRPQSIY